LTAGVFTQQFTVPASAIDVREHVNNLTYLDWCLKAAEAHWKQNASAQIQAHYLWYVLHHSIDYKAAAFEGELLEINTWVTSLEGAKSERRYKIFRIKDNKTLIEAKTIWCLLDAKNHRPTKITKEIRTLFT